MKTNWLDAIQDSEKLYKSLAYVRAYVQSLQGDTKYKIAKELGTTNYQQVERYIDLGKNLVFNVRKGITAFSNIAEFEDVTDLVKACKKGFFIIGKRAGFLGKPSVIEQSERLLALLIDNLYKGSTDDLDKVDITAYFMSLYDSYDSYDELLADVLVSVASKIGEDSNVRGKPVLTNPFNPWGDRTSLPYGVDYVATVEPIKNKIQPLKFEVQEVIDGLIVDANDLPVEKLIRQAYFYTGVRITEPEITQALTAVVDKFIEFKGRKLLGQKYSVLTTESGFLVFPYSNDGVEDDYDSVAHAFGDDRFKGWKLAYSGISAVDQFTIVNNANAKLFQENELIELIRNLVVKK